MDKVPDKNPSDGMEGHAYGFQPGTSEDGLVRVGPGTPAGEMFRRYWHPVAASAKLKDLPVAVKVLGEELVLFRDRRGNPGLVYPRCIHRGTSLFYGRVEEAGIRCCYHGWLFDTQGKCLEQPCEPNGGVNLERYVQPWYPVEERYGLVFAYLGPPEQKPTLPRYDLLEDLEGGAYELFVDDDHIISGDPQPDYNWLQKAENSLNPFHVYILHNNISREQFHRYFTVRPKVEWSYTDHGIKAVTERRTEGKIVYRINDVVFPNLSIVGNPLAHEFDRSVVIGWKVPVDDYHTMDMVIIRAKPEIIELVRSGGYSKALFPKLWVDMSIEDHQREPGDYEAQVSQGPITLHTEENLVTSDTGIAMYRRMLRAAVKDVAEGKTPFGVSFDPDAPRVQIVGGNFLLKEGADEFVKA
jgi:phenylpropionate dioxygenase-like ring-hydroxylating dioxygenase large terminal subunit